MTTALKTSNWARTTVHPWLADQVADELEARDRAGSEHQTAVDRVRDAEASLPALARKSGDVDTVAREMNAQRDRVEILTIRANETFELAASADGKLGRAVRENWWNDVCQERRTTLAIAERERLQQIHKEAALTANAAMLAVDSYDRLWSTFLAGGRSSGSGAAATRPAGDALTAVNAYNRVPPEVINPLVRGLAGGSAPTSDGVDREDFSEHPLSFDISTLPEANAESIRASRAWNDEVRRGHGGRAAVA